MSVMIAHASIAENGGINGTPGDSTEKEVCIRSYYDAKWVYVLRCKNKNGAEKIAQAMENAANNNNIGYGQSDRLSLYTAVGLIARAKVQAIRPEHIKMVQTKVNCDCSSLVALACISAGYTQVAPYMTTWNEYDNIINTGAFEVVTYALKDISQLKRGDILVANEHTAVVVTPHKAQETPGGTEKPVDVTAAGIADSFKKGIAGAYMIDVDGTALRDKPTTKSKSLITLQKGDIINNYGYYTKNGAYTWMYCTFSKNNVLYTGFVFAGRAVKLGV